MKKESLTVRLPEGASEDGLKALVASVDPSAVCERLSPKARPNSRMRLWWRVVPSAESYGRMYEELVTSSTLEAVALPAYASFGDDILSLATRSSGAKPEPVSVTVKLRSGGKLSNEAAFKRLLSGLRPEASCELLFPGEQSDSELSLFWLVKVTQKHCGRLLKDLRKFPSIEWANVPPARNSLAHSEPAWISLELSKASSCEALFVAIAAIEPTATCEQIFPGETDPELTIHWLVRVEKSELVRVLAAIKEIPFVANVIETPGIRLNV